MKRPTAIQLLFFILVIGVAFGIGRWQAPSSGDSSASEHSAESTGVEPTWTCSMHPQVRQPDPGKCPICAMDLIPVTQDGDEETEGELPRLRLSERSLALMNIQTAPVQRRESHAELELPGRLAVDETRKALVSSWFWGRVDRLYVDYAGTRVGEGEHLAELYSPQLFGAQEEFLQALAASRRQGEGAAPAIVDAARSKLRLLGLSPLQIDAIAEAGEARTHLTTHSPVSGTVLERLVTAGQYVNVGSPLFSVADLSHLWAELEAYESELSWLRYGQKVKLSVKSFPGENFEGSIAFIDTQVDPERRTARVRVNLPNPEGMLKPGMLVSGKIQARAGQGGTVLGSFPEGKWISPMHPEIVKDGPGTCDICGMDLVPIEELGYYAAAKGGEENPLVIPASAPLYTGRRSIVYVRLPDGDRPAFEAREVQLGPRLGAVYPVMSGLREGDLVVTSGQFKIDSELQIRGRPSMMAPEGGGAPSHDHGEMSIPTGEETEEKRDPREPPSVETWAADVEASFGRELKPLFKRYLDLSESLAGDDETAAGSALESLHGILMEIGLHRLSGTAHLAWMEHFQAMDQAIHRMAESTGMANRRSHLQELTTIMESLYVNFGAGQLPELYRAHCPMVEGGVEIDGEPIGTWLQRDDDLANPYWGALMLRCGDFHGRLTPETVQTP